MRRNLRHKNTYFLNPTTHTGSTIPVNSSYDYYKMSGGTTITGITTGLKGKQVCVELLTDTTFTNSATLILPGSEDLEGVIGEIFRFAQTSSTAWTCISNNRLGGGTVTAVGSLTLTEGQIVFPATQDASSNVNTLDDYEEGTYVPTILCSTSGSYTAHSNWPWFYTKIGNLVSIYSTLYIYAPSSPNGIVRVSLPFTNSLPGCSGILTLRVTGNSNSGNIRAHIEGSLLNIEKIDPYGTSTYITNSNVDSAWRLGINLKYKTT